MYSKMESTPNIPNQIDKVDKIKFEVDFALKKIEENLDMKRSKILYEENIAKIKARQLVVIPKNYKFLKKNMKYNNGINLELNKSSNKDKSPSPSRQYQKPKKNILKFNKF